ncbi:MAG: NADH:flavin oxidoreductase, partial [Panacagrimonas sp.]
MNTSVPPALSRAFEPWSLGPLRLRNRFIKSATNEGMARGGMPSRALLEHHRAIAAGGVGMTTLAYCAISADGRTFE